MVREVRLEKYLPEFMQDYAEPVSALKAENPEFSIIWKAADRTMYNRFISTADEDGISGFEKMLNIYPTAGDTLESRRFRVQNRWFNNIPSTMKALIQKITILCQDTDFEISDNFESGYVLKVDTNLEMFGKVMELEHILDSMVPCSVVVESLNIIKANEPGLVNFISGAATSSIMVTAANYTERIVSGDRVLNLYIPADYREGTRDGAENLSIRDSSRDAKFELGQDMGVVSVET